MKNLTISVFGNQTFSEILKELKLFSDVKIKHYDDLLLCKKEAENKCAKKALKKIASKKTK